MKVYSFADFTSILPRRPTYALIGHSINNSISYFLHTECFRRKGIDADFLLIDVTSEEFPRTLLLAQDKLAGFSCTTKYTKQLVRFLDAQDERVVALGACNTVAVRNQHYFGYNTDGLCFVDALALSNVSLEGARVLLLGTKSTARAIAYEALIRNAVLTVAGQTLAHTQDFCHLFSHHSTTPTTFDTVSGSYDIVVNTTPVGMPPQMGASPLEWNRIEDTTFAYDYIYNPPMTQFLHKAEQRGIKTDNGLSALVLQGLAAQTIWLGHKFSDARDILLQVTLDYTKLRLGDRNLVLTGFMGAGKTTWGSRLARILGRKFYDIDRMVERAAGTPIPAFLATHSKAELSMLEARVIRDLSEKKRAVIATNWCSVTRPQNVSMLHKNGFFLFLDTPFPVLRRRICRDCSHPLLQGGNTSGTIKALYRAQLPFYQATADSTAPMSSVETTISQLLRYL